jgi:hypothetical protein
MKGKSTAQSHEAETIKKLEEKMISLTIDIIYVDGDAFFVSLSDPINFFILKKIESKSLASLSVVLASVISMYRGEGFVVHTVLYDNEAINDPTQLNSRLVWC